ncbi:MAG: polyhydroxyalkanoic acid system family protein [Thermomonas sp.]
MSRIDIAHAHSMTKAKARKAIDEVASKLAERFQMVCVWDGDVLTFSRAGVDGQIELLPKELRVHAKLGFLAAMFKDSIQTEIMKVLDERF